MSFRLETVASAGSCLTGHHWNQLLNLIGILGNL